MDEIIEEMAETVEETVFMNEDRIGRSETVEKTK